MFASAVASLPRMSVMSLEFPATSDSRLVTSVWMVESWLVMVPRSVFIVLIEDWIELMSDVFVLTSPC
jgi:hypothetical protein